MGLEDMKKEQQQTLEAIGLGSREVLLFLLLMQDDDDDDDDDDNVIISSENKII